MRRRRRRVGTAPGVIALALVASGGLALALGLGLPDPGAAERAFAGLIGVLGCVPALRWLRSNGDGRAAPERLRLAVDDRQEPRPQAPAVESAQNLQRALTLGTVTIGSYNLLVRSRLQALAAGKLARAGCRLSDGRAALQLLGDGWSLVDPATPPPADPNAPGVSLRRIDQLVERLERMQ
ncbi:MAG TPA: hypothetical protein VEH29_12285 [Acidimicrobiales bacterium]|nr:hypothetical protein [Acidimicrobiales bacterium]